MDPAVLDHLLRTMAAVPPGRRVLVRGASSGVTEAGAEEQSEAGGRTTPSALARLGLEVHAAPWTDELAQRMHQAAEEDGDTPGVYATSGPVGTLPYPEAHFGWVVVQAGRLTKAAADEQRAALQALLQEARHHLRPGGWVFVAAPPSVTPEALAEAATQAALAEAEAPERAESLPDEGGDGQTRGIYRRVEEETPP